MKYFCEKDKAEIKQTVFLCEKCNTPYHPSCVRYHKVRNAKGELQECDGKFKTIDLKNNSSNNNSNNETTQMDVVQASDETQIGSKGETKSNEQKQTKGKKRMRLDDSESSRHTTDEDVLRRIIQMTIRAEVCPLKDKIDELQSEIVSLKQIVNNLTSENAKLQENNIQNRSNVYNVSYANVIKDKSKDAVLVVKPANVDTATQDNANNNENINKIKYNIDINELGVGVRSIQEKKNGTVVVKLKNVNDKGKLHKCFSEKIGDDFKVQAPKAQKKYVKILYINNDEAALTDDQLINDIVRQNSLRDCCKKVEMKIVKRIRYDKNNEFNVIIEVNSELLKVLLSLEKVSIGWKQCKIIEHINVIRCFKCCGFNHYASNCKREITCGKCGGTHSRKTCKSIDIKCTNCAHSKTKKKNKDVNIDDKHNAFDKSCPIYCKIAESYKKRADECS